MSTTNAIATNAAVDNLQLTPDMVVAVLRQANDIICRPDDLDDVIKGRGYGLVAAQLARQAMSEGVELFDMIEWATGWASTLEKSADSFAQRRACATIRGLVGAIAERRFDVTSRTQEDERIALEKEVTELVRANEASHALEAWGVVFDGAVWMTHGTASEFPEHLQGAAAEMAMRLLIIVAAYDPDEGPSCAIHGLQRLLDAHRERNAKRASGQA